MIQKVFLDGGDDQLLLADRAQIQMSAGYTYGEWQKSELMVKNNSEGRQST